MPRGALTLPEVLSAVSTYSDWSSPLMTQLSYCESRWRPWEVNATPVWEAGKPLHSAGLLGVLGGSTDVRTNVAQAHSLWLEQGYGAWQGDFSDGCAYGHAMSADG